MLIDCDGCKMQHTTACEDCVVTYLLRDADGPFELDHEQIDAVRILSEGGLIAPLRLVPLHGSEAASA